MNPVAKLAGFALVLAAALGAGAALGAAVGPIDTGSGDAPSHAVEGPAAHDGGHEVP